jgi:hypothetical protein
MKSKRISTFLITIMIETVFATAVAGSVNKIYKRANSSTEGSVYND